MSMRAHIRLPIVTSDDGKNCDPSCPHLHPLDVGCCTAFGAGPTWLDVDSWARAPECIAATSPITCAGCKHMRVDGGIAPPRDEVQVEVTCAKFVHAYVPFRGGQFVPCNACGGKDWEVEE